MARYIDADAYIKYCEEHRIPLNIDAVKAQPTVDVPDRKVGKWIFLKADGSVTSTAVHLYPVCSECGFEHPIAKYCPNCGAEMNNWLVLR